jgi:hypothetical protein
MARLPAVSAAVLTVLTAAQVAVLLAPAVRRRAVRQSQQD